MIRDKLIETLLNNIIDEVLGRNDLDETKRIGFEKNLKYFREKYNV